MIDMASVYAERFKQNPQALQAAVMGQSPDPKLDPYTALNALRLIKEANTMAMAGKAQQPTSSPSIVAETLAPAVPQGLGALVPGAMGQAPQPQPRPPQAQPAPPSGGLAAMPTPTRAFAGGGVVAFADGELVEDENQYGANVQNVEPQVDEDGNVLTGEGNIDLQRLAAQNYLLSRKAVADTPDEAVTPEDLIKYRKQYLKMLKDESGPDIYGPALSRLEAREKARVAGLETDKGLALLAAAGNILKGNTLARGASEAAPAFAKQMSEANRASQAEQRSIEQMQFYYADAQRKERKGDLAGAQAAAESYRKARQDAAKNKFNKNKALAEIDVRAMQATRPVRPPSATGPKLPEQLGAAEVAYRHNPTPENLRTLQGVQAAVDRAKTSISGYTPERLYLEGDRARTAEDKAIDLVVDKERFLDPAVLNAKTPQELEDAMRDLRRRIKARRESEQAAPTPRTTPEGLPPGSKLGKMTSNGQEVFDSRGKLIGYWKK